METPEFFSEIRTAIREELAKQLLTSKPFFTIVEAATYLSLSPDYVRKLTQRGTIKSHQPSGKIIYITRKDLDDYVFQNNENIHLKAETIASTYILKNQFNKGNGK